VPDPLAQIEAAAVLLQQHGFDLAAAHIRRSAEFYAEIAGIENSRGHSAKAEAAIALRNGWLRKAAAQWRDLPLSQQANYLATRFDVYFTRSWQRDRDKSTCPYQAGTERAAFWQALRAFDRPIGEQQCKRILAGDASGGG
jgi:hypothetical protein